MNAPTAILNIARARELQARVAEGDLANRVIAKPVDPFAPQAICHGCFRPKADLASRGHGRGCYFDERNEGSFRS